VTGASKQERVLPCSTARWRIASQGEFLESERPLSWSELQVQLTAVCSYLLASERASRLAPAPLTISKCVFASEIESHLQVSARLGQRQDVLDQHELGPTVVPVGV
jgi:hypothetical protein